MNSYSQGTQRANNQTTYMGRGTTPLNMWYSGVQNATAFTTTGPTNDFLYAQAFIISRQLIIAKISFELTTSGAAGSKARVGIYKNTSPTVLYPSDLFLDSGEFDTTVTARILTTSGLSTVIPPGIYWFVTLTGTAVPTLRCLSAANYPHILGAPSTLATLNQRLLVARAYGALPASFPAGGAFSANLTPMVNLEFA